MAIGQPGQSGHQRLVLEDGLQHALGHLGLIRRIGGHELGTAGQGPDHGGDLVVVGTPAGEADQTVDAGPVALAQRLHVGEHVRLTHPIGQLERLLQANRFRDDREQVVESGQAEEGQHGLDLVLGMRDVVAHEPPMPLSSSLSLPLAASGVTPSRRDEGRLRDRGAETPPPLLDLDDGPGVGNRRIQQGQGDAVSEDRREVTARHRPHPAPVPKDDAALSRRLPAVGSQPGQPAADATLALGQQCLATVEGRLVPSHDPSEPGL